MNKGSDYRDDRSLLQLLSAVVVHFIAKNEKTEEIFGEKSDWLQFSVALKLYTLLRKKLERSTPWSTFHTSLLEGPTFSITNVRLGRKRLTVTL